MCKFSLEKKLSMLRKGGDKQIRLTFFPLDQLALSNAKLPKKKTIPSEKEDHWR